MDGWFVTKAIQRERERERKREREMEGSRAIEEEWQSVQQRHGF